MKLPRQDMERHVEESTHKHLVLMSVALRECQEQLKTISVKNEAQMQSIHKHICTCSRYFPTLRVPKYSHRKGVGDWWNSPPLYTHPGGYKFRIAVNIYGYKGAYGTHVTVSMDALKGKFDSILPWPAKATLTLQLLNQDGDQGHLTVTKTFEWPKPAVGFFAKPSSAPFVGFFGKKFISHGELEEKSDNKAKYLVDDSLFFRIKVEMDDVN